jgi:hypothetical protein
LARKSLSISLDPEVDILVGDPLTVLIHDSSLEHCGSALHKADFVGNLSGATSEACCSPQADIAPSFLPTEGAVI